MNANLSHAPNLTQRPPRSPRVRLGGYVVLARILDKGRAEIAVTGTVIATLNEVTIRATFEIPAPMPSAA